MRNSWIDDRLDDLNGKVDELGQRMDRRFDSIDRRFELVDGRFEGIDQRFDALQRTMVQGLIGICAAMITGFAAIVAAIVAAN